MKINKIFLSGLVLAAVAAASCKSSGNLPAEVRKLEPSAAERDSASYLLGVAFGSYIKNFNLGGAQEIDFGRLEEGICDFLAAKLLPGDEGYDEEFDIAPSQSNEVFERYLAKRYDFVKARNHEAEAGFLKKMEQEGFTRTESGLLHIISNPGSETLVKELDTLGVNFTAYLPDGTVFAQSPAGEPSEITVKEGGLVTKGWVEGLCLVGEGGQVSLVLPAELAYGQTGRRGVEPNLPVRIDMEVVSVKPAPVKEH